MVLLINMNYHHFLQKVYSSVVDGIGRKTCSYLLLLLATYSHCWSHGRGKFIYKNNCVFNYKKKNLWKIE